MSNEMRRAPMAVILADGVGSRLSPLTDNCAKSMLSVGGSVILERAIRNCLSCGISQFVLVLGHREDEVRKFVDKTFRGIRVTYVINDQYRRSSTGYSLMLASSGVGRSEFIKFDADVVFETKLLRALLDSELPDVLCMDRNSALASEKVKIFADDQMRVFKIGKSTDPASALGASIGIEKISAATGPLLFAKLEEMMASPLNAKDDYESAYARLIENGLSFHALDITGMTWTKIDTAEDLAAANAMFGSPVMTVSRGQQKALDGKADYPGANVQDG
jgi:choline kinase